MKTDGWVVAQRLHFYTIEEQPPPEANQKSYVVNDFIHAVNFPFNIKVDRQKHLGEGSSRQSYPAPVPSSENGQEVINKWVAKIRYSDPQPNVSNHASDSITYWGFGLILTEFKDLISEILDGAIDKPNEVYFFESHLDGNFVKYSSNLNFHLSPNQKGMDPNYLSLMNIALTHWSYNQSRVQQLVCDLQGFGPILTDPKMVDLNADAWAEGNSAGTGINAFLNEHVCSTVFNILKLGQGGKAVDLKWKCPTPRQPLAFERILASKNQGVFSVSEASDDSDLPKILL
ncbi:Eukaryotic elongation factor-2 kinase [Puccinia graminis f. sp. tritici]|uniref:Eukaryotic elongation factor-2 kinase n=1 Tax=Puccinia graminis f. sp. tritici TaxID=56615 RepID=A0A5B0NAX1_PUCGR|nr:Eukaryotic elongation factor-2 kinase [Puccinia graminis f. sp. tritici]